MVDELARLRARHRASLLDGRAEVSTSWGQDCLAYNVVIRPAEEARSRLYATEQELAAREPGLLCVPADALHISVAWLLAVHRDYPRTKSSLWAEHGGDWLSGLRRIASSTSGFDIHYWKLAATDSAIIAIAESSGPVNQIRRQIADSLDLPAQSRNSATLVHTTLCRYGGQLKDPASLLNFVNNYSLSVHSRVASLEVSRELVYPSLQTDRVASLPLGRGCNHFDSA